MKLQRQSVKGQSVIPIDIQFNIVLIYIDDMSVLIYIR